MDGRRGSGVRGPPRGRNRQAQRLEQEKRTDRSFKGVLQREFTLGEGPAGEGTECGGHHEGEADEGRDWSRNKKRTDPAFKGALHA